MTAGVAIGRVAEFNPPTPRVFSSAEQEAAFLPMASVSEDGTMFVNDYRQVSSIRNGYSYFRSGDVLVAKITPCFENNKIALARIDRPHGFGSTEFHVIRPTAGELDARYLAHFLRQDSVRESGQRRMTGSAGQRRVPRLFLEQLEIPLPPLEEQRRIAAILDQADALRRKRREALADIDRLSEAIFFQMFGNPNNQSARWPGLDFGRACRDETSKSEKLQRGDYLASGLHPVVDQGQSRVAGWSDDEKLLCRSELPVIVFGDHTRAVKFVDFPFVIGADGAKVLKPSARFAPVFFAYLLRRMPLPDLGYSRHMREVKRMTFPCPPLTLQQTFAKRIHMVDQSRAIQLNHLAILDALFVSLQHRAFRCEL